MADGADEHLVLTRCRDSEARSSASTMMLEAWHFLSKIEYLFGGEQGCLKVPGYTTCMLQWLKHPFVVSLKDEMFTVGMEGDIPSEVMRSCFESMTLWLAMAKEVCIAEWPDYMLAPSMAIFNVCSEIDVSKSESTLVSLDRIAHTFGEGKDRFKAQYFNIYPRVKEVATRCRCTNEFAWAKYFEEQSKRSARTQANNPHDALVAPCYAWHGLGVATSGVESNLGISRVMWKDSQKHADAETEDWMHNLIHAEEYDNPHDLPGIIDLATRAYICLWGPPKRQTVRRIDKGVKNNHVL